jgi:hypothetical protein
MSNLTEAQKQSDEVGYYTVPSMIEKINSCWSLGPLEVCVTKISNDRIDVEINLAGVKIGSGSLTVGNTQICASANIGIVKASVCVTADFPAQTVWVEGEVCSRRWDGGWNCTSFKTKILSW